MKKKLKSVIFNGYGQVFAFDDQGQVAELQEGLPMIFAQKAHELGYEVDGLEIETTCGSIRLIQWEYDGEQNFNWEAL